MSWKLILSIPGFGRIKKVVDDLFKRLKDLENSFHLFEYRVDQIYRNVVTALMANRTPVLTLHSALNPENMIPLGELLSREADSASIAGAELENDPDARFAEPVTAADREYLSANRRRLQVTLDMLLSLPQGQGNLMVVADLATSCLYHPGLRACFPASKLIFVGSEQGDLPASKDTDIVEWVPGFSAETGTIPLPDASVDLVLCLEVLERLTVDPMQLLSEINRILKMGGRLLLSTPNPVSWKAAVNVLTGCSPLSYGKFSRTRQPGLGHVRKWTPSEVETLFRAAGIEPVLTTQNVHHRATPETIRGILQATGVSNRLSGDTIFALGTKCGEVVDRYPSQFYE
ncbi:MAG TPA: hypothetical protein DCE18_07685 [Syntrophobacteraceae bacterium]|nr:hypothetical protein [Syntrophobacteraceae bacterium]HBZ56580.1 hypothetical protein [Syntrophobacteraceae bacterium]